jgi:hypothetical protein
LTPVAGDQCRRALLRGSREGSDHSTVGALARPVHRREREDGELDRELLAVGVQEIDDRTRHDAPHAPRFELALLDGQIPCGGAPVDRGRRHGDDELGDVVLTGGFEQPQRPADRRDVLIDWCRAVRHGREVEQHIGPAHRHQARHLRRAGVEMVDLELAAGGSG